MEADTLYAVIAATSRCVKIGRARDVRKRLATLQAGSPEHLEVLAYAPGYGHCERRLHDRYCAHRLHGEWFAPPVADDLESRCRRASDGACDTLATLAKGVKPIGSRGRRVVSDFESDRQKIERLERQVQRQTAALAKLSEDVEVCRRLYSMSDDAREELRHTLHLAVSWHRCDMPEAVSEQIYRYINYSDSDVRRFLARFPAQRAKASR